MLSSVGPMGRRGLSCLFRESRPGRGNSADELVQTPNQAPHLAEPHFPCVAFASISCGLPLFLSEFGTLSRACVLYATGFGMCHAVSKMVAELRGREFDTRVLTTEAFFRNQSQD